MSVVAPAMTQPLLWLKLSALDLGWSGVRDSS